VALATQQDRETWLLAALRTFDMDIGDVREELVGAFGDPLFVVVTGSILAGFGNDESDIDVYLVVEDETVMAVPLPSYRNGARIDSRFFSAYQIRRFEELLAVTSGVPGTSEEEHLAVVSSLETLARLAVGLPILKSERWEAWSASPEISQLPGNAQNFWESELWRRRFALDLLMIDGGSYLLALRAQDLAHAALELVATAGDHLFFGRKWLPLKLRQMGREDLRSRFFDVLLASRAEEAIAIATEIADLALELTGRGSNWAFSLVPASGVLDHSFAGRHFFTRWGLRGTESAVGAVDLADASFADPVDVPHALRYLHNEDFLWLSTQRQP